MRTHEKQEGIALLITLLLTGVLLSIGASLLNVTLKQYQFSGLALASETAFQAANAGMECILYYDFLDAAASPFDVDANGGTVPEESSIRCMNETSGDIADGGANNTVVSGEEQRFLFSFGELCSEVSVYKFSEAPLADGNNVGPSIIVDGVDMNGGTPCPEGGICTVVQSRGYNVSCDETSTNVRAVEREYTQVY